MNNQYIFGYGSLVNRGTHEYERAHRARLRGWRREWRHTSLRPVAYLTAVPDPESEIDGLILGVPHGEPGLESREHAYVREDVSHAVIHEAQGPAHVHVYTIPEGRHGRPSGELPILLSYIDVVVRGYLHEFGLPGVEHFFATTAGWSAPVRNDRDAPVYPRHQRLNPEETSLVDDMLAEVGAQVI